MLVVTAQSPGASRANVLTATVRSNSIELRTGAGKGLDLEGGDIRDHRSRLLTFTEFVLISPSNRVQKLSATTFAGRISRTVRLVPGHHIVGHH
jgi:hypothetical protein